MLFTKNNVEAILSQHSTVFFKPTDGSGGFKIVKITKNHSTYSIKYRSTQKTFPTQNKLYQWMKVFAGDRSFILQQGISLAQTKGKPFDIRVMMQRDSEGHWKPTAIFCKVGRQGKVATNYNQGGHIEFIEKALAGAGYSSEAQSTMLNELRQLGLLVSKVFSSHNSGFKELGLDVALDQYGKPWILEVNTRPQFYPLKDMKNKELYYKILSYAKQYGRKK